jgi:hypothetical protein
MMIDIHLAWPAPELTGRIRAKHPHLADGGVSKAALVIHEGGKMVNTCDWPDCGCRETVEWRYDKGWGSFAGYESEEKRPPGLPSAGMLCIHHQEALEAWDDGDMERFLLLASI